MLHKAKKIIGFHILAVDGEIGHVDDLLVDETTWTVRYLVVDTSNWIGGRTVLISTSSVDAIDAPEQEVRVKLNREEIKTSRTLETADIELIETLPSVWIM